MYIHILEQENETIEDFDGYVSEKLEEFKRDGATIIDVQFLALNNKLISIIKMNYNE